MVNISDIGVNFSTIGGLLGKCQINFGEYDAACVYNHFCTQFNDYFIKMGISVVVVYIVGGWFLWWFLQHGYKMLPWDKINKDPVMLRLLMGDMRNIETRQYWDACIRDLITKFAVGFAAVVVFLSIYKK